MTVMHMKRLDEIDYISGRILLTQFTEGVEAQYYVVRVEQYCHNLEYLKVPSMKEARSLFLSKCEEYKEKLSQGRPYIEFQLAEREDGLWEFRSDMTLPGIFYDPETRCPDLRPRTFKSMEEAIHFGRTCRGKWIKSMEGHYDILYKTGQVTRALSLKHIDWKSKPRMPDDFIAP